MSEPFQFVLLGLGGGGIYALVAVGVVLVYKTSKVVNFAAGAMGMVGTFVFWELADNDNVNFWLALLAGLVTSGLIGFLSYMFVMRRLRARSQLIRIMATIAILAVLQAAAGLHYTAAIYAAAPFLPHAVWTIAGVRVGQDRILLFIISIVVVAVLYAVYRFSAFGRSTTAVAENERSAAAVGISPDMVAAVNWTVAAALSGLAGILLAPIAGLGVASLSLLVVPALAAAVVGDLASFPLTLAGGLAIGIAQSEISRYVTTTGWSDAVPFILLALVLLARGKTIAPRGHGADRLPTAGTGKVRSLILLATVAAALLAVWILPVGWVGAVSVQAAVAIIVLSQLAITGYAGQVSLAQFAFAGMGALVAARLMADAGLPFELAVVIAVLATVPLTVLVGLAGVRTRGVNLAMGAWHRAQLSVR